MSAGKAWPAAPALKSRVRGHATLPGGCVVVDSYWISLVSIALNPTPSAFQLVLTKSPLLTSSPTQHLHEYLRYVATKESTRSSKEDSRKAEKSLQAGTFAAIAVLTRFLSTFNGGSP